MPLDNSQYPLVLRMHAPDAELSYRFWPHSSPTATFVHFHGIESHSGWYTDFGTQLWSRGISVYCMDRAGSGLSSGPRGHIRSWRTWIAHAEAMVDRVRADNPHDPICLSGSCWGAKVALGLALRKHTDGLVLIAPALQMRVGLTLSAKISVAAAALLCPKRHYSIPIEREEMFTQIPDQLDFIRKDPLRLKTATAKFLVETKKLDRHIDRNINKVRVPTLALLAEKDVIVNTPAVEAQLRNINGVDLHTIPNTWHSMEFLPSGEKLAREIVLWMPGLKEQQTRLPRRQLRENKKQENYVTSN